MIQVDAQLMVRLIRERLELLAALRPFVEDYQAQRNEGTADLWDNQPMFVKVTLGDCRNAERLLAMIDKEHTDAAPH